MDRLYARHEEDVLRFFMERVRAPDLAADLTAETFAAALTARFDPTRQSELDWLLGLANTQLLRAYRVGAVDRSARERLKVPPVALDARALDRVWQLRGPDRRSETKPRRSPGIVLAETAHGSRATAWSTVADGRPTAARTPAVRGATGAAPAPLAEGAVLLPGVAGSLAAAADRRHGGRRRRRRVVVGARIAVALVTATWVVGAAVIPDRPASASSTVWLPFEAQHEVAGDYSRLWYFALSHQAPAVAGARELMTVTTYATGDATDRHCGALRTLGDADALVSVLDRPGARTGGAPDRPEHFRARFERAFRACRPGLRVSRMPFRDGDRVFDALVVLGPSATRRTEAVALETLDRVRFSTSPA